MLPVKVLEEGAWPTLEHRTLSFRKALADTAQTMLDLAFPASETEKMHVCLFFFFNELPSYIDFCWSNRVGQTEAEGKVPSPGKEALLPTVPSAGGQLSRCSKVWDSVGM